MAKQISFRWRFGFGYGFPFSDSTGAACEADPNGVCHLKTADGKSKQVISKSVLLDRISLDTPDCTERSLKQHISNLRKKMQDVSGVDYIETVWGIGFKLAEQKS